MDGVARGAVVAGSTLKAVTRMRGQARSDILAKAAPPVFSDDNGGVVVRIHREEGLRRTWSQRGSDAGGGECRSNQSLGDRSSELEEGLMTCR